MRSGSHRDTVSDDRRLLGLLVSLAVVLIACKAWLLPLPGLHPAGAVRWAVRLGVVAAADVAYVAILGSVLWALLRLAGVFWRRGAGWFWPLAWTAVVLSAVYGAAGAVIFRHLEMQLTYPLLQFFGEWRAMAASVRAAVGWPTWLGLASAVGVLAAGYRLATWCLSRRPPGMSRRGVMLFAGLAIAYFSFSFYWSRTQWQDRSLWQARLAASPHLRLIESLAVVGPMIQTADFRPDAAEFDDFRPPPKAGESIRPKAKSDPPKNVVLVVLESVGAEYLGLYGAPYDNTPNLERLSKHALVFENIYAQCPSSAKAMVAMLCGVYPRMDWHEQTGTGEMPAASLADVLRWRGYRTGFFHSGDWSWRGGDRFLAEHGFQHIRDARHLPKQRLSWGQYDRWLHDQVFAWIDRSEDPFLAMVWTIQTHHPYVVRGTEHDYGVADPELNRYLNAVGESDELIGRIWRGLCERGLAKSTLLVVIGDHGEAFGQHHQRLHIFGLYEENVHVPLVIVHDGRQLPVGRRETIGQQVDLPATLAACVGVPASSDWQGRSLLSPRRSPRAYFYTVWDPVILGVRQGRFKYTMERYRGEAIFDLAADPDELHNVVQDHAELRAELGRRLHALVAYERQWRERWILRGPSHGTAGGSDRRRERVGAAAYSADAPRSDPPVGGGICRGTLPRS